MILILRIILFVSGLQEEAPFTISDLSEENMLDSNYGDELSSEELVLQDLQRASQKVELPVILLVAFLAVHLRFLSDKSCFS